MKIFILNIGSSSIKCFLYDFGQTLPHQPIKACWEAQVAWKNDFEEPFLFIKNEAGVQHSEAIKEETVGLALKYLMKYLFKGKTAVLRSLDEIDVIGHRIVHGGKYFKKSVYITPQVKEQIRLLSELAPLHNLWELEGIEILEELLKKTPQIAVFDTAFHHTLPQSAQIYPGPYSWYEVGIQRYGFHGISFQYCSRRAAEILNRELGSLRMVVCHLGSGASLCAIKGGKSIDTTMGFTPLEGLMMDTRCGSIDPGILLYLLEKKEVSLKELSKMLYEKSGLLGISGISSDMEEIIKKTLTGDERASIALDVYLHRLNSCMGAMIAALRGIDAIIFTGGIGERGVLIRERVCENFSFLGMQLDNVQNAQISSQDKVLSTENSKIKILLIHTQEAFHIACECWKMSSTQ